MNEDRSFLKVGFSTNKQDFISRLIRKVTWSRYSHVVLISPDGLSYIESTHGIGVRELPIQNFLTKDNYEIAKIFHPYPGSVWNLARHEVGKPYDEWYIWGYLFRRNWQDDSKWACCELIPSMAERCGHSLIRSSEFFKVSPQTLYMISMPQI